jgi:Na+-transporting NADH:ubiquinone oxidoreductase subunit NqrB
MQQKILNLDPRGFQVFFQLFFLAYGIACLGWTADWLHYLICIGGCLAFNFLAESIRHGKWQPFLGPRGWTSWGFSILISAMSLCLLLKTNHWYTSLLAAFATVISKYLFRVNKKHVFNPSAFGIVMTLWFTRDAWLSPGQWGNGPLLFFLIILLGTLVVTRVQKMDSSLGFIIPFLALLFWRQIYVLGWPADYFFHSISNGGLLLFAFFMITDPRTSPNHPTARLIWAFAIAVISFYLTAFKWIFNAPIFVLVFMAPFVPLLDALFVALRFEWIPEKLSLNLFHQENKQS